MSVEIQPYFAEGERYPALIGVRAEGDEYETAYVSKSELVDALAENAKLRESVRRLMTQRDERLARAEADNAKLQETLQRRTEQFEGMAEMWVERGVENYRLRELAAGIGHLLFTLDVDYCAICPRDDINHPCPVHTVEGGECLYKTDMRDLGMEVDA